MEPRAKATVRVRRRLSTVRFGEEAIDLERGIEPISHATFRSLMDDDDDEEEESCQPHFAFARVHSKCGETEYRHLYSAANIVEWYPLKGRADPCTRGEIRKIEYYLYMKGEGEAIHVGDVYGPSHEDDATTRPVSKTADYLIWSLTAKDEPSRMLAVVALAFLQCLGIDSIAADDAFDTSDVSRLRPRSEHDSEPRRNVRRSNGTRLLRYVRARLSRSIERGDLVCSDPEVLVASLARDASHHLAQVLVAQDATVHEESDDYARIPHVRSNALAAAIVEHCCRRGGVPDDEGFGVLAPRDGPVPSADDRSTARRRSI